MKKIFTFLLSSAFLLANAQSYREKKAVQLDLRQQYLAAYEIWQELANEQMGENLYDANVLLNCAMDAYYTEKYDDAIRWFSAMKVKDVYRLNRHEFYIKCLIYRNQWNQLGLLMDSVVSINKDWNWKMALDERVEFVKNYGVAKGDFQVQLIPSKNGEEEFALFPFGKNQMAFVSNGIEGNWLASKEGRTGGNFYRVITCDSSDLNDRNRKAKVFDEIQNGRYHWGPIYFSKSCQKMFITVNEPEKSKEGLARMHQLKLRYFTKNNEDWREVDFPWNSKEFSTGHATMDTLGNIIFASDRPGGLGGTDLYKTSFMNGVWTEPQNLGPEINSKGNEMFPFVSSNGDLYFASDGWPGLGGLDIFGYYSTSVAPENLLPPLNSSNDDFAFWINEGNNKGFLSSNRTQERDQLYSFTTPAYPVNIKVLAEYCDNAAFANDSIVVRDANNGKEIKIVTDENGVCYFKGRKGGYYQFEIPANKLTNGVRQDLQVTHPGNFEVNLQPQLMDQVIVFQISNEKSKPIEGALVELYKQGAKKPKKKILSPIDGIVELKKSELMDLDSVHISFINHSDFNWHKTQLSCVDTLQVPVILKMFKKEEFINLDLILYDYGKYSLRPISKDELDKLVGYMKKHPGMKVELSSHTDCRGTFQFNENLSQNRSNSCVQYIISKGIDPSLIIAKGYGEYKLKNRCKDGVSCSEEEHQENRRTELHILLNNPDQ